MDLNMGAVSLTLFIETLYICTSINTNTKVAGAKPQGRYE